MELLEETASAAAAASTASSSRVEWPFEPPRSASSPVSGSAGIRIRSCYLNRVLERPLLQARAARVAAHLAAQAAQVDFVFSFGLLKFNPFIFYHVLMKFEFMFIGAKE